MASVLNISTGFYLHEGLHCLNMQVKLSLKKKIHHVKLNDSTLVIICLLLCEVIFCLGRYLSA